MILHLLLAVILGQYLSANGCMQVRPLNAAVLRARSTNGATVGTRAAPTVPAGRSVSVGSTGPIAGTSTGAAAAREPDTGPTGDSAGHVAGAAAPVGTTRGSAVPDTLSRTADVPGSAATEIDDSGTTGTAGTNATEELTTSKPIQSIANRLKFVGPIEQKSVRPGCVQPPQTSSLFVSDTVDQHNDVSFGPLGGPDSAAYEKRCECGNGTIYYYKSVSTTSWFEILAKAQQAVDLTCAAMNSICVCDTADICYTATNSTVHAVLASYCDREGACNLYMLVEGDTDDEGMVPIDGGPVVRSGDQYAPESTTPYMINSPTYDYKKISAIACGQCPIYRPQCSADSS